MSEFWQGVLYGVGGTIVAIALVFVWACCRLDDRSEEWREQWDSHGVLD